MDPPAHFVLYFTAWLVHWVGRGVAKPLVELLVELRTELRAELLQGFGRARCFDVCHVDFAITYRTQVFF